MNATLMELTKRRLVARMFAQGCALDEVLRRRDLAADAALVRREWAELTGRREFYALHSNTKRGE